ncbi:MAG: TolC family protein [Betaproteobacteria bacterium]
MTRLFIRLVLGLCCSCSGAAGAADDFDRLLAQALATHPVVEGSRAGLEAARADREGAEWQRYPTPAFEASGPKSGITTGFFTPTGNLLSLEQPIWAGGRISAGIRAAGFREAAAEAAVAEAKQTMTLRMISAYTELLRLGQRQNYARTAVDQHDTLVALISRRVAQDVSPPADREFAQSRLAQAAAELSISNQGVQVAQAQLSQLVGRQIGAIEDVRLDGRILPATLEEAMSLSVERSPVLARLEQTALAAGEDVESKRAVIMPQVAVRLERQFGTSNDSRALLVFRAQPGAGLSAGSAIAAAQRRMEQARLAREEARRNVLEQAQTAFTEWRAAQVRRESARSAATLAQSVFDSYSRQYVAGRKTWIDVLNAVREISQSQYALADVEALARASALRLWLLIGEAQ